MKSRHLVHTAVTNHNFGWGLQYILAGFGPHIILQVVHLEGTVHVSLRRMHL